RHRLRQIKLAEDIPDRVGRCRVLADAHRGHGPTLGLHDNARATDLGTAVLSPNTQSCSNTHRAAFASSRASADSCAGTQSPSSTTATGRNVIGACLGETVACPIPQSRTATVGLSAGLCAAARRPGPVPGGARF